MKKNIIFLIAVLSFAFYGCSDSQNLTDLNSLFTAKAVLSSSNSNADKILPVKEKSLHNTTLH